MVRFETTRFGTLAIQDEKIITMPYGILGFSDKKRFAILQHKENSPFYWLQSLEDPALAFVIMNPFLIVPDYNIDVDHVLKQMSWEASGEENNLELYVIVNVPKDSPEKTTANLIGPILVNNKTRQAVQMIISDSPYSHKVSLV